MTPEQIAAAFVRGADRRKRLADLIRQYGEEEYRSGHDAGYDLSYELSRED